VVVRRGWSACFGCFDPCDDVFMTVTTPFFFSSAVLHRVFAKVMRIANRVVAYNIYHAIFLPLYVMEN
jgi:hypothetical protein